MVRFAGILLFAAAAAALLAADDDAAARGKWLFLDTQEGQYPSCAHCHATVEEKEEAKLELLGPAGTLHGSADREGWRGMRTFADAAEASQYCARTWQKRKGGLDKEKSKELLAYLQSIAPGDAKLPMRKVQKSPKLLDSYPEGDAGKGKALSARYCNGCHNDRDDAMSFELLPRKRTRDQIARKVRGYDDQRKWKPEEGTMSYYATDRLSDADLAHILAWLGK